MFLCIVEFCGEVVKKFRIDLLELSKKAFSLPRSVALYTSRGLLGESDEREQGENVKALTKRKARNMVLLTLVSLSLPPLSQGSIDE